MKDFEVEFDFFSTRRFDNILWINFQKNLLIQATSLANRELILTYLNQVATAEEISILVISSSLKESGHKEYIEFFQNIKSKKSNLDLHRLCNVYASLILKIISLNKFVIHAASGNVIPLFLNTSLACDYRIAADNTVYKNSYLDMGILPIGGGPYFLSKLIGNGKAYEFLALKSHYTAVDAIENGIIDKIVPADDLEEATLAIARQFERIHPSTLIGLKRLLTYSTKDFEKYLEFESQELFKIIHHQSFKHPKKK